MSFATILATLSGKRPFWLYEFRRDGELYFFTRSGDEKFTAQADYFDQTDVFSDGDFFSRGWLPRTITHTRFMETGAIARALTEIVMPQDDAFARTFLEDLTYDQNTITIYQGFANDPDGEIVIRFRGRVIGAKTSLTRIVLLCENRFTELRAKAITRVMQKTCQNVLYFKPANGAGCGASLEANQIDMSASALTGNLLTVAAAASYADGFFTGGVIEYNGARQMISAHRGSQIALLNGLPGLADAIAGGAQPVKLARGCNRGRTHCAQLGQLENYFGFPWMKESPYDGRNVF